MNAEEVVRGIARRVADGGGRALLVGGCVRDRLLGRARKDFDLEVFGLPARSLESLLRESFEVLDVGRSFGVLKLKGLPIDVSLPRRETRVSRGHRGFEVATDPQLSLREAALRRDLTINAMYEDPRSGEILDPLRGREDLERRILRHCSDRFAEDPLRVLRVMQFAARFEFAVHAGTVDLCRSMDLAELPRERIEEEWRKLLLDGVRPSRGLAFLESCAALRHYPELKALVGTPQNPLWHPEGDVFVHTGHCLDHFATERRGDASDWTVGLALLCHDLGKPATTRLVDGVWRSIAHSEAGALPTRSFLARLTEERRLTETVVALVRFHLRPFELHRAGASDSAVRRLATKVNLELLIRVARHDHAGRPPLPFDGFPAGIWLGETARRLRLEDRAPRPLVQGRHLIEQGGRPGPHFGPILARCFEAQLEGKFEDLEGGKRFLAELLAGRTAGSDADESLNPGP